MDAGGPGQRRGGLGQTIEIAHREGAPFVISKMFDRIAHPPRGRFGGGEGRTGSVYTREGERFAAKGRDVVPADHMLVLETPGGGGMGDIAKRDPEQVMADVRAGLVSTAAALSEYGVEVTDAPA